MVADLKRTPLSLHFGCNEQPNDAAARKCLCQKGKESFQSRNKQQNQEMNNKKTSFNTMLKTAKKENNNAYSYTKEHHHP
ncbi:hypothetical protein HanHA300_Chr03g0114141 [Helianthus annuus]|uniref:Uncharacterized protein n=1 Tax=Helianthus annuus TaxID=4232 RepID=A0A251VBR9_HELAN|nr:hypothetical protein HanHA300_Chr03g0114141 [Helianthus annuus]KAJ0603315.1 hypothetical protein HanIR_Chr03g0149151 [Helianthus annuus]KAJ0610012.1 hypothetical protein HanHA89_Chr03g0126131 [Helianthus annuus]